MQTRNVFLVVKRSGLWNFMNDVDALIKPAEFIKYLKENPPANNCFDAFGNLSKRFMLRHIKIDKIAGIREK